MSDKINIYQRINEIMKAVSYVQKDAAIKGAGASYKAVTHDQVVSITRPLFVQHGVVIFPVQTSESLPIMRDVKNDVKMHLYSGMYDVNFVNIDDPSDRITVTINAHATDNGDKAPGKCVTYATKSAILKVLCLETGENDESREDVREAMKTISTGQQGELAKYCYIEKQDGSIQWSELGSKMAAAYGIGSLSDLHISKFDEALARCKKAQQ